MHEQLTPREREIAAVLHISPNTLKTHIRNLYKQAGVTQKRAFIALAARIPKG